MNKLVRLLVVTGVASALVLGTALNTFANSREGLPGGRVPGSSRV